MSDKLKAWREEARNSLSCVDSVMTESEMPWHRILKLIDIIEVQRDALERIKNYEGGVLQPDASKSCAMRTIASEALEKIEREE